MAATVVRVFGKPITDGTHAQRAVAAKNNENADGKLDQVLQFITQQEKMVAGGPALVPRMSFTFVSMYNATCGNISCQNVHDNWNNGHVVRHYPVSIQNGQWAVFLHFGMCGRYHKGSVGAVVYNIEDNVADSMIAWNNPWKSACGGGLNTAYCEMNSPGYFESCNWDEILKKLMASGAQTQACLGKYATKVTIGKRGNAAFYKAIFCVNV